MKNVKNTSAKFEKFSNALDKKQMNTLFGGFASVSTPNSNTNTNNVIVPVPGF